MNTATTSSLTARLALFGALLLALRASADVVETKNGAREVGKVTSIHGGVVTLETEYAGELKVKQSLVTSITTDHPVAVRLADGTSSVGVVTTPKPGTLKITGPTRSVDAGIDKVAACWAAGEDDPDHRKWSYEAGGDVNGRTGTERQLSTSYHYRAKLAGPADTFQYYTSYTRQEVNNQVSADQFKAGVDYADNFTPTESWYVRDEGGFDRVNFITFYDIAASGFGYDFIKGKDETFTGRLGLSYRYDQYAVGQGPPQSDAGADVGLAYMKKIHTAQFTDKLSFDPAFQDLGNFVINHEMAFEVPLTKSLWKLSTGVANNYYSRPVGGADKLETLYFTRLILTWGAQPAGN
jgi:putative salt-induced outer membrane protein YdiY